MDTLQSKINRGNLYYWCCENETYWNAIEEPLLVSNAIYLARSPFWIMDEMYKTVPTIFKQLYTKHGHVDGDGNSKIMPLVLVFYFILC